MSNTLNVRTKTGTTAISIPETKAGRAVTLEYSFVQEDEWYVCEIDADYFDLLKISIPDLEGYDKVKTLYAKVKDKILTAAEKRAAALAEANPTPEENTPVVS